MKQKTTQSFVPLKEIRDGTIIREDGMFCAVILVSSLNFELKSDVEREAILNQFQNMLNSLEVNVQILIQSRRLNIRPHLEYLQNLYNKQEVELLKLQTKEYIKFITEFTEENEIMTKQFFLIIGYSPIQIKSVAMSFKKPSVDQKQSFFEETQTQLQQRVSFIQNNIRSLGLRAVRLDTESITELLYQTFNPGDVAPVPKL